MIFLYFAPHEPVIERYFGELRSASPEGRRQFRVVRNGQNLQGIRAEEIAIFNVPNHREQWPNELRDMVRIRGLTIISIDDHWGRVKYDDNLAARSGLIR